MKTVTITLTSTDSEDDFCCELDLIKEKLADGCSESSGKSDTTTYHFYVAPPVIPYVHS